MSQDKSKKTEQPTKRSLSDSRKKGQVAKSKEIVSTAILFFTALYFYFNWEHHLEYFDQIIVAPALYYEQNFGFAVKQLLLHISMLGIIYIALPLAILTVFVVILSNIVQFGILFSLFPLKPELQKINPISGLERIFSMKNLGDTFLSFVKVILISLLVIFVIYIALEALPYNALNCDIHCYTDFFQELVLKLMALIIPLLIFLSILDYMLQKHEFMKDQKMTKEEAKRHHKDTEGDPLIKSIRRSLNIEVLSDDFIDRVKQARVIITDYNSAVAIAYNQEEHYLPFVLCKGKGVMLSKMISVAREENVPVIEHAPLTRILVDDGAIDEYIPQSAVRIVAEILKDK